MNLRSGLTAAAVALLTLAPATAAHAAMTTPIQIDAGGSGWTPGAAVNGGAAIVGLQAQSNGLKVITSAGGGQWNPAVTLTTPTAWTNGAAVTVDEDGNQTAVWSEFLMISSGMGMPSPGPTTVRAAHRTANGAWSPSESLNAGGGAVTAVAAPDGRVTATWLQGADVYFATRPLGGAWSTPAKVTGAESSAAVDLDVSKDGTVTAVWADSTSDHTMASTLAEGGTWTAPVDISGSMTSSPALDMDPTGEATVVWNESGGVFASRRAADSTTWTTPEKISGNNGNYGYYAPGVAVESNGRATVAWSEYGSGGYRVYAAERAADGTWGANVHLGPGDSSRPALAATPDGEIHAAWYGLPTRLITRAADGTWGTMTTISAFVNADPVIATDGEGDVLLVGAANGSPVQVAGFDNAGPGLNELSVPATAQVGQAVAFSVAPIDLWSGLGTTTWSFGDGTTATGTSATHQYTSTGTKKVTVTATDAFGRARSRTRALLVTQGVVGDPTPEPPADPTAPAPPAPAPGACTPRTTTTVKWKLPKGTKVRRATISVTGQKARVLKRKARSAQVDLRTTKGNVVTVTVRTRTAKGKLLTKTQRYTVCS